MMNIATLLFDHWWSHGNWTEINMNIQSSGAASILLLMSGLALLCANAKEDYKRSDARLAFVVLAIFILSLFVNLGILLIAAIALLVGIFVIWIIWRLLIKNIMAAFRTQENS